MLKDVWTSLDLHKINAQRSHHIAIKETSDIGSVKDCKRVGRKECGAELDVRSDVVRYDVVMRCNARRCNARRCVVKRGDW